MTKGDKLNNSINKTYEIDVDDVGRVPECKEIQTYHQGKNLYSTPFQAEPVYESPLAMGVVAPSTAQRRESEQQQGRRSKTNDIYESTNDETLSNGEAYTGYSYSRNTDVVSPRFPCTTYDNPVPTTDEEVGEKDHVYEESFRNSRFSENVVYETQRLKSFTIEGVRDTKTGATSYAYGNRRRGQQRATCIQIFTLLLSILAVLIGTFALLVALRTIKLNDLQNEDTPTAIASQSQLRSGNPGGENEGQQSEQNYNELLKKYNETKERVLSSEQNYIDLMEKYISIKKQAERNYTNLMEKYNEIIKQGQQSEQNYNELLKKYNETKEQFTQRKASVDITHEQLNGAIEAINSTFNNKFENVNSNVSSLSRDLEEVNTELRSVNTFGQQLSNTVEDINSTFTTKLRNVSKQMGPRGFNGSQGLQGPQGAQGPQGVGNMSACIVNEIVRSQVIDRSMATIDKAVISYKQRQGWKVISAVCSTKEYAGTLHTVLSRNGDTYICTCAGPSTYSTFSPVIEATGIERMMCVIIYWECPEL